MTFLDRVSRRLSALSRDVNALKSSFGAPPPSPLVHRPARAPRASSLALGTREVRVVSIEKETARAATITFEDLAGTPFRFEPGQFFTLVVNVDGVVYRRAYSASAPPRVDGRVSVTVKAVHGGRVSSYLVNGLREGERFLVLGPSGMFVAPDSPPPSGRIVFIAGGSGITPVMAIVRALLDSASPLRVALVYGNESVSETIFADAIGELATKHPSRFTVHHVLGTIDEGKAGVQGRLDAPVLAGLLDGMAATPGDEYFVCGPSPVLDATVNLLKARAVPSTRVHVERFVSPTTSPADADAAGTGGLVRIRNKGEERAFHCRPGQTILEAALESGEAIPYSCSLGGCGACAVTVVLGEVRVEAPNCLTEDERASRRALTCVGRPLGPCVIEVGS